MVGLNYAQKVGRLDGINSEMNLSNIRKILYKPGDIVIDTKTGNIHTVSHVHISGYKLTIITTDEVKLDPNFVEKK